MFACLVNVVVIEYLWAPGADSLGVPWALSFNDASSPAPTIDSVTFKPTSYDTVVLYLESTIVAFLTITKCFLM